MLKELAAALRNYQRADRLLVPTAEDWYLAGKVIYALQQGAKSKKTGDKPPLSPDLRCRIINDVLIARTAKRAGARGRELQPAALRADQALLRCQADRRRQVFRHLSELAKVFGKIVL